MKAYLENKTIFVKNDDNLVYKVKLEKCPIKLEK